MSERGKERDRAVGVSNAATTVYDGKSVLRSSVSMVQSVGGLFDAGRGDLANIY